MKATIIQKIEAAKVVAIIRSENSLDVRPVIETLIKSGIKALEITSNTPDYCEHISWAREQFPEILTGAGTIISEALAEEACRAGAQFLVTPNMDPEVIAVAKKAGIATLMGAMTPTEIATGLKHGADFIKIFPAGSLGIAYFKALLGPFRGTKFIAVGGINAANAAEWLAAGAVGIGVGGSLTSGTAADLENAVKELLAQIQ